ncbi:MAG: hypothetical protein ACI95T_000726, partial [Flavobacteriales bacterium]
MKFSQRIGITPATKSIQIEDIDTELQNGLWNALKMYFFDTLEKYTQHSRDTEFLLYSKVLWIKFYKFPI